MGIEDIINDAGAQEAEEGLTSEAESQEEVVTESSESEPQETQETEEAPVVDSGEAAAPEKKEEPAVPTDIDDRKEKEIRELRQMLRESKKQLAAMREKVDGIGRKLSDSGDSEEEETTGNIERLQRQIADIATAKSPVLDVLVETMEMSPKYSDVSSVCTRARFDDIFEMVARHESQKSGKPFEEALLEAELSVWKMPNPYKYMYGIIKQYHPDFAKKEESTKPAAKPPVVKPVVAPTSVSGVGGAGGSGTGGGWTAAKIDAMSVEELDSVPHDIYQKYLMGLLK